jgi:hypothetical protein
VTFNKKKTSDSALGHEYKMGKIGLSKKQNKKLKAASNRINYAYNVIMLAHCEWWGPIRGEWHEEWDPLKMTHVREYEDHTFFADRMEGDLYQASLNHGQFERVCEAIEKDGVEMFNFHMKRITDLKSYFDEELVKVGRMMVDIQSRSA